MYNTTEILILYSATATLRPCTVVAVESKLVPRIARIYAALVCVRSRHRVPVQEITFAAKTSTLIIA